MKQQPELQPLAEAMSELRLQRGLPSYRKIAAATGMSPMTIHHMCTGAINNKWETVERVVIYLGGDVPRLMRLLVDAQRQIRTKKDLR